MNKVLPLFVLLAFFSLLLPVHAVSYYFTYDRTIAGPSAYVPGLVVKFDFSYEGGSLGGIANVTRDVIRPDETATWTPSWQHFTFQTDSENGYDITIYASYPDSVNQTVTITVRSGGEQADIQRIPAVAQFLILHLRVQSLKKPLYPSADEVAAAVNAQQQSNYNALQQSEASDHATIVNTLQNVEAIAGVALLGFIGLLWDRFRSRAGHG